MGIMRSKIGMLMGMAMAMTHSTGGMPPTSQSKPQPTPQPKRKVLTPEEEAEELEKSKERFLLDLQNYNDERKRNFPKFKEFELYGLPIIAFSLKNAQRDMLNLMHKNSITIKEN